MNQHYLQLYADFIVKVGVNVQPRQNFIIRCPVTVSYTHLTLPTICSV